MRFGMENKVQPAILVTVKFKTSLTPEELEKRYKERLPEFRALPGLIQKYYLYDHSTDEWGGVYLWDSQASLDKYMGSDLRKSIPDVYQIVDAPRIETSTVIDTLRPA
jgi:hypothetical protein